MNKKKETRAKLQIIFSVIIFCIVMNAQLYMMINFAEEYLSIAILTVLLLICLYFIVSSIFTFKALNDQRNEERYDTIFKSEKASYLLLKKYFEEIDSKLDVLQTVAKVPTEEIVNTQKGIAKVVINRSRENAEALMNSNDQLLDRIANFEDRMDSNNETLLEGQKNVMTNSLSDIVEKQQQLIESIKDMEIRLSQAIANNPVQFNANVEIPPQAMSNINTTPVQPQPEPVTVQNEDTVPDDTGKEEVFGTLDNIESVLEEKSDSSEKAIENVSDEQEAAVGPAEDMSEMIDDIPEPEDISDEIENAEPVDLSEESEEAQEHVEMADEIEEVIEPQIDSQFEDVIADVEAEPVDDANEPEEAETADEPETVKPTEEQVVSTAEATNEPAPSIPMDDPNRQLTPDEIAALIASM